MNYQEAELVDSGQGANQCPPSKMYSVRAMVAFLSLLGSAMMYITRVNLNITILAMVPQVSSEIDPFAHLVGGNASLLVSPNQSTMISTASTLPPAEFDWTPTQQGIILGSFFYGYTATQIIGGRIAESHLSSTKLILFGLGISGILNLVTPFLARISLVVFVLSRIALGAVQGLVYPAFYCLFSKWIPANERSTFFPWLDGGLTIGTVLISASSGYIIVAFSQLGGWPVVFYVSGLLALLWCFAWAMLVRSEPESHPFISKAELDLIMNSREEEGELASVEPNWCAILTSTVFYAVLAPKIAYGIVFDFVTLKIPAYLQDVIHFPVDENGLALAFINFGYMITLITCGIFADSLIVHSSLGKCRIRKLFQLISGATMAGTLLLMPYVGSIKWANVILLMGCMFGYGFTSGGDVPIVADLSGPLAGTVFAIMNTLCSISGFAVPYVVGVVIESAPSSVLLWGSLINGCALLVIGGTAMFFLASSNLQTSWIKESSGYIDIEKKLIPEEPRRNSWRSRQEKAVVAAENTTADYSTFSMSTSK